MPAARENVAPPPPSIHSLINDQVAELGVVCTGVENGRLYFEKLEEGEDDDDRALVEEIAQRLVAAPAAVLQALDSVISVALQKHHRQKS